MAAIRNRILGDVPGSPVVVRMRPVVNMDDDQFFAFCQQNDDLRLERTAEGDLIVQSMAGGYHGARSAELTGQLAAWARRDGTGEGFASCVGFNLPNGATRSPDASWVQRERLSALTRKQWEQFPPLCPDFVAELRDGTDSLAALDAKMQEYIDNGARLEWLIDPENRRVYIYRPNAPVERLDDPATVPGDPELPGFVLDAPAIFAPGI
jgi:Uma2 family endonuclease